MSDARRGDDAARGGRPPWSVFRAELEAAGFRPSRRLGQNFLLDENLLAAIVQDSGVLPGARVLEIGAGCGFLSAHLAARGVRLLAVELDARLHAVAARFLAPTSVRLLHADALAGKHALGPELATELESWAGEPWHVVSNLPYGAASPVLALLAEWPEPPSSLTVLVQREVAERLAAAPGDAAWGPLGLRLQLAYEVRLLRRVPPQLFWPRPKVESAVVRLDLRPVRPAAAERERLDRLVSELFQKRRKTLRAGLAARIGRPEAELVLSRLTLDPLRRAETLTIAELRALSAALPAPPG